ncbi:hypothetical protein niasHT_006448 [Heterodera trifolii]|uniref:ISXO2-like transposase domain-containing protein n=1 Tax=Heterodera trifolii TaxID=157864 RepID=A0ABD2LXF4_9BILA
MLRLDKKTVIDWNCFYRDVCSRWLLAHPIRLGGIGNIVQIDESLVARRKYHRGRRVREQWVFGMYDVHAHVGIVQLVPDRTRNTLLPIIEQYVLPGTTIHSDQWAPYMGGAIAAIPVVPPYVHQSVNHAQNFVDPLTGAHTNHVENFWKNLKMKNKAMSGTQRDLLPGYMDEYMWRQFYGKKTLLAFENIFDHIAMHQQNVSLSSMSAFVWSVRSPIQMAQLAYYHMINSNNQSIFESVNERTKEKLTLEKVSRYDVVNLLLKRCPIGETVQWENDGNWDGKLNNVKFELWRGNNTIGPCLHHQRTKKRIKASKSRLSARK